MVRYWAHNPGTDNASLGPTLAEVVVGMPVIRMGKTIK